MGGQIISATKGVGNPGSIELGDDVDQMGLVNNTRGGFNMSPLNVEGNGTAIDDDDLTVDAQQNDIVDDEEQLIGNTAGGSDDELRLPSDNEKNTVSTDPNVEDENETQPIKSIMDQ